MSSKFSGYQGAYIEETIYQGKKLLPCGEYQGKKVYNKSWYFGIDALQVGDFVDQDIADDIINCLPPACLKYGFVQLGEASAHKTNPRTGKIAAVYAVKDMASRGRSIELFMQDLVKVLVDIVYVHKSGGVRSLVNTSDYKEGIAQLTQEIDAQTALRYIDELTKV